MSEISLFRKYRPQRFNDMVGQDHITITLLNAVIANRISQAYLFFGPRGTGKTSAARIVAKALNCDAIQNDGEPCLNCAFCKDIQEGRLIDVIEIDAASNRGIDEIRDLREKIKFLPTHGKKKVYIIDEVHMLTKEAFNALLKTLEEPPAHAHFVLATTEIHKIPETIISRCQRFDFHRISNIEIVKQLGYIAKLENLEVEEEALKLIASNVQGALRDAISLLEQMIKDRAISLERARETIGCASSHSLRDFVNLLNSQDVSTLLSFIDNLYKEGCDLAQFVKEIIEYLRELMLNKVYEGKFSEVSQLVSFINQFQEAHFKLKDAIIPQLPLEIAIIKSCQTPIKIKEELKKENVATIRPNLDKIILNERIHRTAKVSDSYIPLNLETLNENHLRILEHIKTPSVRRSFSEASLKELKGQEITYIFKSKFHFEKINKAANKEEIVRAFEEIFGKGMLLHFDLNEIPLSYEEQKSELPRIKEAEALNDPQVLANKVMDLFGGEMVE